MYGSCPYPLGAHRIQAAPEGSPINAERIGARAIRQAFRNVDDRAGKRQFRAHQPVGAVPRTERMARQESLPAIHAIDRIVFGVSGMKEPQHTFKSPDRVR